MKPKQSKQVEQGLLHLSNNDFLAAFDCFEAVRTHTPAQADAWYLAGLAAHHGVEREAHRPRHRPPDPARGDDVAPDGRGERREARSSLCLGWRQRAACASARRAVEGKLATEITAHPEREREAIRFAGVS